MKNKNVKDEKKEKKIGLTTKIFIALLLGAVFGIVLCYLIPDSKVKNDIIVEGILYVIGQGFIRLMKMLVVPLVFCSLVCGSMAIGDTKKLGTVGVRTLVFYLATTALAVTVALSVGNLINPGVGLDMSSIQSSASSVETMEATSLTDTILNIIPDNPINSLASGTMLQVIVFALIVGVILAKMGERAETVHALEQGGDHPPGEHAHVLPHDHDVLGPHHHVHRLVLAEAAVHAGELLPAVQITGPAHNSYHRIHRWQSDLSRETWQSVRREVLSHDPLSTCKVPMPVHLRQNHLPQ